MSGDFKSQMLEKNKMYRDRITINTMCQQLCSMYYLDMPTYKLEFRIARGMVKNRLCQGSFLYFPPGTEVAGDIVMLHSSSSEISSGRSPEK